MRGYPGPPGVAGTGGYPGAKAWAEDLFQRAFEACMGNAGLVASSQRCGCFCCARVFLAEEVVEWWQGDARCPHCGIDSVLPETGGFSLNRDFLLAMRRRWHGEHADALSGPIAPVGDR